MSRGGRLRFPVERRPSKAVLERSIRLKGRLHGRGRRSQTSGWKSRRFGKTSRFERKRSRQNHDGFSPLRKNSNNERLNWHGRRSIYKIETVRLPRAWRKLRSR